MSRLKSFLRRNGALSAFAILPWLGSPLAEAVTYPLPASSDSLFGALDVTTSAPKDTLLDIARVYDLGYREIKIANPRVDVLLPGDDTEIIIPSLYVLPRELRSGRASIVINVAEFRLYHLERERSGRVHLHTYPISIGRQEWQTPHGTTSIVAKAKDPAWYPPESVREEHESWGDPLPRIVPPGDENPLGKFALRLGLPGYLIHGTNRPYGIGMRVTHGCVRMYPRDIEQLFHAAPVGMPVTIVNRPFKVGRLGTSLYLEAHPALEEAQEHSASGISAVVDLIARETDGLNIELEWERLKAAVALKDGIPTRIGMVKTPAAEAPFLSENRPAAGATGNASSR